MNTKKLNSLTKRLDYKKLSNKKKRKYLQQINILEKKEIKYMNYEFIEKEEENIKIEIGDILLCADEHDLHPLLIISDSGTVSAINLTTCASEHTGDYLEELHNIIKLSWNINEIIKKENVLLQLKRS